MSPTVSHPHITPPYYARGRRHLMKADPKLAAIIKRAGPCRMLAYQHANPFAALVETIVSQQLSVRVADVIFGRVCDLCGPAPHAGNGSRRGRAPADPTPTGLGAGVSPERILALDHTQLRGAGLSGAKARYVHELASRITDGSLVLGDLDHLPDEEVTRVLSEVKGIGTWSTHMFLIFRLHRPDVWPIGDLGIVKGLQRYHGFRKVPKPAKLERMGEIWRPYRSLAAWYLWRSLSLPDEATDA